MPKSNIINRAEKHFQTCDLHDGAIVVDDLPAIGEDRNS
jgi:hypothetical protein